MFYIVTIILVFQSVNVLSARIVRRTEKEWHTKDLPHFKYTIDQLLSAHFPKKTSNDIFLDPCKSGKSICPYNYVNLIFFGKVRTITKTLLMLFS